MWMVDGPVAEQHPSGVLLGGVVLLLLGAGEAFVFGVRRWLAARPLAAIDAAMREQLHRHLQRLPIAFHDRSSAGQLLSRGTTDLQLLHAFLAEPLTFLVVNAVTLLVGIVILASLQWALALIVLVPLLPIIVICLKFQLAHSRMAREGQELTGDLTTSGEESAIGIYTIKGFHQQRSRLADFRARAGLLRATELGKARFLARLSAVIVVLPELAVAGTLVMGTVQVANGGLSAGALLAFLTASLALRPTVESTGFLLAVSNEAAAAVDRFFTVLDEPVAHTGRSANLGHRRPQRSGELAFHDVAFRYPDADPEAPPVLHGVTLRIAPGETVAFVGATGSGKSTLAALVPRLYEPTSGRITLDGTDIRSLPVEELRGQLSVVFDKPTLFSLSVAENVLMGAEHSDETDLVRALEAAEADGFVARLPQGPYATLRQRGTSLSGGQRQRIALARAFVGRTGLVVLDDPLSALDLHTEARVTRALTRALADTTALVIAQRPSTVLLADRVALLEGGTVAASGLHRELLRTNATYASLMTAVESAAARVGGGGVRSVRPSRRRPTPAVRRALRPRRAGHHAGPAGADLPSRAAAEHRPPRPVHLRATDLPGNDRRGCTQAATRGRHGQDRHGRALRHVHLGGAPLPGLGAGVAALLVMIPLYLTMRVFRRRSIRVYRRRSSQLATVITTFAENVSGIRTVQVYRRERANDRRFAVLNDRYKECNGDAGLEMARFVTVSRLVANTAIAGLVVWGAYRVAESGLELGIFAAAVLYLRRLYDEPLKLGGVLDAYQSASASLEKIAALLARDSSVRPPQSPRRLPAEPDAAPGRRVTFEHVRFAYRDGDDVLPSLDLTVPAGQTLAVVGPTGAGKSSLAKLLARFYDPVAGRVLLDDVDLRDLAADDLAAQVVLVPQDDLLFSGTVSENITVGRPDADASQIEQVAKAVGAHPFIAALPHGYLTRLRGRSGQLSTGQRQLISLARALLADPAVIILDETTSGLDIPSERAVRSALRTVLGDRTALVIAHRLSTVQIADRVLVMDAGRVIEDGSPDELVTGDGPFSRLHRAWLDNNTPTDDRTRDSGEASRSDS